MFNHKYTVVLVLVMLEHSIHFVRVISHDMGGAIAITITLLDHFFYEGPQQLGIDIDAQSV